MPSELIGTQRSTESSSSEDLFVEIFQEALGFERTQLLIPQYPVSDVYGTSRFIDFAFISRLDKYAFEIDGEAWHAPGGAMVDPKTYRDELLRQNSLVYQGWKVYRWTDVQLAVDRERLKEQLLLFLEREITEGTLDGFLPRQEGSEVSLREHQFNALQQLSDLRNQGKTIALLTHATGTGKTHIALSHAQNLELKTLYLAHRTPLLSQTQARFAEIWPDVSCAMSAHRLFGKSSYRSGGLVAAPAEMIEEEERRIATGEKPVVMLALNLWVARYEPIDIFTGRMK